jgi:inhibitor of cysteine peptidase
MHPSKFDCLLSKPVMSLVILSFIYSCKSSPHTEIKVSAGKKFVIELPSNRSTGYSWHYIPTDNSHVDSVKVSYTTPQNNIVGGEGIEIWEFMANGKGHESLLFEYKRSWENIAPAKTQIFHINIE